jgi:hypothetical protein
MYPSYPSPQALICRRLTMPRRAVYSGRGSLGRLDPGTLPETRTWRPRRPHQSSTSGGGDLKCWCLQLFWTGRLKGEGEGGRGGRGRGILWWHLSLDVQGILSFQSRADFMDRGWANNDAILNTQMILNVSQGCFRFSPIRECKRFCASLDCYSRRKVADGPKFSTDPSTPWDRAPFVAWGCSVPALLHEM